MTLQELINSDKEMLLIADIAEILIANPQSIRSQVHVSPESLGFPVCVMGTRVRIPRRPFLRFLGIEPHDHVGSEEPC